MELAAVAAVLALIAAARNRRQGNAQPAPEPPADSPAPRRSAPRRQPALSIELPEPDIPEVSISVPDVSRYAQRGFSEASRALSDAAPDVSRYAAAGFSTLADALPPTPDVSRYAQRGFSEASRAVSDAAAGFSTLADALPPTPNVSRYAQRSFSEVANALPDVDVADAPSLGDVVGILAGPISSAFNAAGMSREIGEAVNRLFGWNTNKRDWRKRAVRKLSEALDAGDLTTYRDLWASDGRWVSAVIGSFATDRNGGSFDLTAQALGQEVRERLNLNLSPQLRQALAYDLAQWGAAMMENQEERSRLFASGTPERDLPAPPAPPERIKLWNRLLFQFQAAA
jgi:hypothetical protein